MKTIKLILLLVFVSFIAVSCNDTKDCKCTIEVPSKAKLNKLQRTVSFKDWDTDCSKITTEDLDDGQILINPCSEM